MNHDTHIAVDCAKQNLTLTLDSTRAAAGCTSTAGAIFISAGGGREPYSFFLNDELRQTEDQTGLRPGIYTVRLQDANGCSAALDNIKVTATGISFTTTLTEDTECLSGNGAVTVEVPEGNPPYQYRIDDGAFSEDNTFTGLSSGYHHVEVMDNEDCTLSLNITVPRGQSEVSWANDIRPLLTTYCATTGCHNGISRSNDFRIYSSAKFYASSIRSKTQDRSMPFDGSLSAAQIGIIACWVDDGALNN